MLIIFLPLEVRIFNRETALLYNLRTIIGVPVVVTSVYVSLVVNGNRSIESYIRNMCDILITVSILIKVSIAYTTKGEFWNSFLSGDGSGVWGVCLIALLIRALLGLANTYKFPRFNK